MKNRNHGGGVLNDTSDPFSGFQISERRAANNIEERSLTPEQAAEIECTAEWRNKRLNEEFGVFWLGYLLSYTKTNEQKDS